MDSAPESLPVTPLPPRRGWRARATVAEPKPLNLQPLPRWVGQGATATGSWPSARPETAALISPEACAGAALFALEQIIRADLAWLGALRMRLALHAAIASARLLRLSADEAALRDAEQLTRPGDDPGPAGRVHRLWRRFAAQPAQLAGEIIEALGMEVGAGEGASEVIALMQADIALAAALGWERPLPLAATVIADPVWRGTQERRPFRVGGEGWEARRMAVFGVASVRAHALAVALARRAEIVTAAAETLRTRDGGAGLALILADDCIAPWRMAGQQTAGRKGLGSDRAARRFSESLHGMGALRLLTDRPTFRLYGL
jgi:Protein of unknown function (DUF1403)